MALMRRLRDAVDPGGLANPGKMLAPAHEPRRRDARRRQRRGGAGGGPRGARACCRSAAARSRRCRRRPPTTSSPSTSPSLRGIVEYDPAELTFTALAGTPVAELDAALAVARPAPAVRPAAARGRRDARRRRRGRDLGPRRLPRTAACATSSSACGSSTAPAGSSRAAARSSRTPPGSTCPSSWSARWAASASSSQLTLKVFPRPRATTTLVFELGSTEAALAAMARLGARAARPRRARPRAARPPARAPRRRPRGARRARRPPRRRPCRPPPSGSAPTTTRRCGATPPSSRGCRRTAAWSARR